MPESKSRQSQIVIAVFKDRYSKGRTSIEFTRPDLFDVCKKYDIEPLKNMGDGALYSYRYRIKLPDEILETQPEGKEWVILGKGIAKYEFRLVSKSNIVPNEDFITTKIPDSTPEIIKRYAFTDEQALLARIGYNRLVDTFFGITTYSLQNHLRTTVDSIGQIEIDEIYVGVDKHGRHFVIPAQAKVKNDRIGYAQLYQDLAYCMEKYPNLVCKALAAKFMKGNVIALFELTIEKNSVKVVHERHYELVAENQISKDDLRSYIDRATD